MEKKIIQKYQINIAIVHSDMVFINDAQSALDFMMSVCYNDNCTRIVINKDAIIDDFFTLSTGVAGEILQKAVNYSIKIAIVGDFGKYQSKALKDFIYECNNGKDVFFVGDEKSAIEKLVNRTILI